MLCLMQQKHGTNLLLPAMYTFPKYHFLLCIDKRELWFLQWWSQSFWRNSLFVEAWFWLMQASTHAGCEPPENTFDLCSAPAEPYSMAQKSTYKHYAASTFRSLEWGVFFVVLEIEEYFEFIWALQQWSDYYILCHTELAKFSTESYRTAAKCSLAW